MIKSQRLLQMNKGLTFLCTGSPTQASPGKATLGSEAKKEAQSPSLPHLVQAVAFRASLFPPLTLNSTPRAEGGPNTGVGEHPAAAALNTTSVNSTTTINLAFLMKTKPQRKPIRRGNKGPSCTVNREPPGWNKPSCCCGKFTSVFKFKQRLKHYLRGN